MTWSDFYLICFAVGFCFSFLSFVFGSSRLGHLHLPHFHGHAGAHFPAAHGSVGHGGVGHGGAGHAPAAGAHAPAASHGMAAADDSSANHVAPTGTHNSASPFNFVTLTAFLAWFGGTGYLLTRFSSV